MKNRGKWIALVGCVVVGCTAGVVGRTVVEGAASAQQVTAYEYHCENTRSRWNDDEISSVFNQLGAAGWELVTITVDKDLDYQACFKRQRR